MTAAGGEVTATLQIKLETKQYELLLRKEPLLFFTRMPTHADAGAASLSPPLDLPPVTVATHGAFRVSIAKDFHANRLKVCQKMSDSRVSKDKRRFFES